MALILSAKSARLAPRDSRTTCPLPRGTWTPPMVGACMLSNSWRRCFFDFLVRATAAAGPPEGALGPPRAAAAAARTCRAATAAAGAGRAPGPPPAPGRRRHYAVLRRHRGHHRPAAGAGASTAGAAGTATATRAAGTATARAGRAGRDGMFIGLGRGPPGRGQRTRRDAGRRPSGPTGTTGAAGTAACGDGDRRSRPGLGLRWPGLAGNGTLGPGRGRRAHTGRG